MNFWFDIRQGADWVAFLWAQLVDAAFDVGVHIQNIASLDRWPPLLIAVLLIMSAFYFSFLIAGFLFCLAVSIPVFVAGTSPFIATVIFFLIALGEENRIRALCWMIRFYRKARRWKKRLQRSIRVRTKRKGRKVGSKRNERTR